MNLEDHESFTTSRQNSALPEERVIVALDVPSKNKALRVVETLGDECTFYKVGPVLFYREGPQVVEWLRSQGKHVFLDLKAHDIPSVVESATQAAALMGVTFFTAHIADGSAGAAAKAARKAEASSGQKLYVLGVTVLTSTQPAAPETGSADTLLKRLLLERIRQAVFSGCDGVVAAASDLLLVFDSLPKDLLRVCPGIRLNDASESTQDDQARTATPLEAAAYGADYIVVGRPILQSSDPLKVFRLASRQFASGLRDSGANNRHDSCSTEVPLSKRSPTHSEKSPEDSED